MVCYKCDYCGKETEVKNEGKLLYPENIISVSGESFIYCSKFCMNRGKNVIVTGKEVNDILLSLNKLSISPSFVQQLTAY